VLVLERDGAAVVDHHARTGYAQHRGRAAPELLARLDAAVRASGFPDAPRPPFVVPDSTICTIELERGGQTAWLTASVPDLRPVPGYAELLEALDEVVRVVSAARR
jgi:hypothetical protein